MLEICDIIWVLNISQQFWAPKWVSYLGGTSEELFKMECSVLLIVPPDQRKSNFHSTLSKSTFSLRKIPKEVKVLMRICHYNFSRFPSKSDTPDISSTPARLFVAVKVLALERGPVSAPDSWRICFTQIDQTSWSRCVQCRNQQPTL